MHGYLSSGKSFAFQIPCFKRYFNVFAPDLTGFGDNKNMDFPYTLDDYVREVRDYIEKNGLKKPHVIAHSFGARIVLKGIYTYPDLFDKVVITGGAGLKPKKTFKKSFKTVSYKFLKTFIKKEKLTRFFSKDYLSLSPVMRESFIKIVNEHLDYTLPKINNETLLLYGEKDKETPLYMARRLNSGLKNSRLTIFKGAGHFAFIDKPFNFNTEVKEFLLS